MAKSPARFPVHAGPELRSLLRACHDNFDDDTPRLVLADWLEEHDDPRGACIRLQCQLAALPAGDPQYDALMERHQKWWKSHGRLWAKEVGSLLWECGPHDRGLPTVGHYDDEDAWLTTGDVRNPAEHPKHRLSATIADGWPGMTWVVPAALIGDDEFELELDDDEEEYDEPDDGDPFWALGGPPWADSPTPVGIALPEGPAVDGQLIDDAAESVPNLRGLSLAEADADARLLRHIARIPALTHLNLGPGTLTDAGVRALAPLANLRVLIAPAASFTNAGAAELAANFPELRELRVGTYRLTAAGFKALAGLTKLEVLQLDKADDAAVRHLAPLSRLRELNLSGTSVTGAGVEAFPLLTALRLESTPATDAGLAGVGALARLQYLDLSDTRMTGAALAHLSGLRWLEELHVSGTATRDKDLVHLEPLKRLEFLSLDRTRATKPGRTALQKKLKGVNVL